MKTNQNDLQELKNSFIELEKKGYVDFFNISCDDISYKINKEKVYDYLISLPQIPFPTKVYISLRNKTDKCKDKLAYLLAINMYLLEQNDRDIPKTIASLRKQVTIPEDIANENCELINNWYDLDNPIISKDNSEVYLFKIKQEIMNLLRKSE